MLDILIIASDREYRDHLHSLLACSEYRVSAAGSVDEAAALSSGGNFRLVVLDEVAGLSMQESVRSVKAMLPAADVLVIAGTDSEDGVFEVLKAGASGYVGKQVPPLRLVAAVEEVRAGGAPMSRTTARKILQEFQEPAGAQEEKVPSPLSKRETEILELLYRGYNYRDIAEQLFISFSTVHSHVKNIYVKLHVNSRSEAIYAALQKKLLR